jgi:uncharacterized protein
MNIEVRVITNAKRREITYEGSGLKVKLTALPRQGKANEELVEYLASLFRLRKADIEITRGEKDKRKVVFLPIDDAALKEFFKKRATVTVG